MSGCGCEGARCVIAADDPRHGTSNGYSNLRCRCRPCRDAHATYFREGAAATPRKRYLAKLVKQGLTNRGTQRKQPYVPRGASVLSREELVEHWQQWVDGADS